MSGLHILAGDVSFCPREGLYGHLDRSQCNSQFSSWIPAVDLVALVKMVDYSCFRGTPRRVRHYYRLCVLLEPLSRCQWPSQLSTGMGGLPNTVILLLSRFFWEALDSYGIVI